MPVEGLWQGCSCQCAPESGMQAKAKGLVFSNVRCTSSQWTMSFSRASKCLYDFLRINFVGSDEWDGHLIIQIPQSRRLVNRSGSGTIKQRMLTGQFSRTFF